MFERYTTQIFPDEAIVRPNDRHGRPEPDLLVPAGTTIFSADNHIELSEDIFFERFPDSMKDRAPRVWDNGGVPGIGVGGESFLPEAYNEVLAPFAGLPGGNSSHMEERMRDMADDGIEKELAFPNAILALLGFPDFEVRELCFRTYNQYIAEIQQRYPDRFYGVGLINWWDPKGTRETLAELKALGLRTYLLPINPGTFPDGVPIDYASTRMIPVWEEIEASGLPVAHHIGETFSQPCEFNRMSISFVHSAIPFRDLFARYIFGGILDRHPGLQVGWFEGGINWVVSAIQDAEFSHRSFWHMENLRIEHDPEYYWRNHMCASFMVDPLGLEMIDRIGYENVMWSCDYPHNESSFSYSRRSVNHVAGIVGAERAPAVLGGNVSRFLKL